MLLYATHDHSLHLEAIDGEPETLRLRREDGSSARIPAALIGKLLARYGRELDADIEPDGEELALTEGQRLQAFRWRAGVDASGRDYLALHRPGAPPLACMATQVAAALDHLWATRDS